MYIPANLQPRVLHDDNNAMAGMLKISLFAVSRYFFFILHDPTFFYEVVEKDILRAKRKMTVNLKKKIKRKKGSWKWDQVNKNDKETMPYLKFDDEPISHLNWKLILYFICFV